MKENKYDNSQFYEKYSEMTRSKSGLAAAGEWYALEKMLPDFRGKRLLDLGCGFGWHCQYAAEHGAKSVLGLDISEKMLEKARELNKYSQVEYLRMAVEDINFTQNAFDVILSSLTFHYIESFDDICDKVRACLTDGGDFIFSVEHPVFTAQGKQDWHYDNNGNRLHWPVDNYYVEGKRDAVFLGEKVVKYHRTLTTYLNKLMQKGFQLSGVVEAEPQPEMLEEFPEFKDELRRPMILLIAAKKI